jgi:hypothetical protein
LRAKDALAFSAAIAVGSAAAVLTMVLLYGTRVGFAFLWRQLMSRVDERTGAGAFGFVEYSGILLKQMEMSWPAAMLAVLAVMTLVVIAYALAAIGGAGSRPGAYADGQLLLLAMILGFGGPLVYCYRLQDLVAIHWWFSGTWAVGWAMTVCAFTFVVRSSLERVGRSAARRRLDVAFCALLFAMVVGWNLQFADLAAKEGAFAEGTVLTPAVNASHEIYRAVGSALPHDGTPLVVADMPHLFNDYPFATAYLRRPVVRMSASGALSKLGTAEDALPALIQRGGEVYVAYDRSLHLCAHPDVTPDAWRAVTALAFCRVPVAALARQSVSVLADGPDGQAAVFAQWIADEIAGRACCDGQGLLGVTRLVDSRLRVRPGDAVAAARRSAPDPFQTLIDQWKERFGGSVQVVDPRFAEVFAIGIAADGDRWYLLLVNGGGLPDFHDGVTVMANGRALDVLTPYQTRTTDGQARLPLSLIVVRAPSGLPRHNVTIEIMERGAALARTNNVEVVEWSASRAMRRAEQNALISLSTGCTGPPGAPGRLQARPAPAGRVSLFWSGAPGGPEAYVLHGGSAPAATDVTQADLGDAATRFDATRVPRGTYYLRVRGRNACGVGAASNEVVAVVP